MKGKIYDILYQDLEPEEKLHEIEKVLIKHTKNENIKEFSTGENIFFYSITLGFPALIGFIIGVLL